MQRHIFHEVSINRLTFQCVLAEGGFCGAPHGGVVLLTVSPIAGGTVEILLHKRMGLRHSEVKDQWGFRHPTDVVLPGFDINDAIHLSIEIGCELLFDYAAHHWWCEAVEHNIPGGAPQDFYASSAWKSLKLWVCHNHEEAWRIWGGAGALSNIGNWYDRARSSADVDGFLRLLNSSKDQSSPGGL